jgi:hemerythrin-like domain-containing protein
MIENIEHHIEEEEGEMFTKARQVFDDKELDELGDAMAERKAELMPAVKAGRV